MAVTVTAQWRANCTSLSSAETISLSKNGIKNFDYSGTEKCAILSNPGYYKLETWGAQGGNSGASSGNYIGGFGGYSVGIINATKNLYVSVVVGGAGGYCSTGSCLVRGGYNGGGDSKAYVQEEGHQSTVGGGGGATHIATVGGQLKNLTSYKDTGGTNISKEILIASGGGGAGNYCNPSNYSNGGHGGGYQSTNAVNIGAPHWSGNSGGRQIATQVSGFKFGIGGNSQNAEYPFSSQRAIVGGGGGWYGGIGGDINGSPGGSGYIGSSNLISGGDITKHMTCYSCTTSTAAATRTNSNTTTPTSTPTADVARIGNGYARITYLGTSI